GFIKEVAIKTGYDTYQSIKGDYYNIKYKPIDTSSEGETVLFASDEYIFNENMKYQVVMAGVPYELINMYEDVTMLSWNFTCPGYKHSCRFVSLEIDNCTIDREYNTVLMHGLGWPNGSKINLTRDLIIKLQVEGDETKLPITTEYYYNGNDSFEIKIPVYDIKGNVASVSIQVADCPTELYKVTDKQKCIMKKIANKTAFATVGTEYECKPKNNKTEEESNICSQVIMLPPAVPEKEPSKTGLILDFLVKITKFVISIPQI
ncbi:MAG: hypothetical protein ABIF10_07400, partial [Candidatus Woesearchaeota archaeon]